MDSLLPGIVGGIFSLLAIWLQNHLKTGKPDSPPTRVDDTPPISGARSAKLRRMALLNRPNPVSGERRAPEPQQTPDIQVAVAASVPAAEVYQAPSAGQGQPATASKADGMNYIKQGLIVFAVDFLLFLFDIIFFGVFEAEAASTLRTWFIMFIALVIPIYASGLIIFGGYSVWRSWLRGRVQ